MKNKSKKRCVNHSDRFVFSGDLCINCYRFLHAKPLTKTPIKPVSEKQKNMLVVYRMLRRKYLKEHPQCEVNLLGCTIQSTEIHHTAKKYTTDLWLNIKLFKAVCRTCHNRIEASPLLAKNLGIYNYTLSNEKDIPFIADDFIPMLDD